MSYASNYIAENTSGTLLQDCKNVRKGKSFAFYYHKGAEVCYSALRILGGILELSYLFIMAVCLTLPVIIAIEIFYRSGNKKTASSLRVVDLVSDL